MFRRPGAPSCLTCNYVCFRARKSQPFGHGQTLIFVTQIINTPGKRWRCYGGHESESEQGLPTNQCHSNFARDVDSESETSTIQSNSSGDEDNTKVKASFLARKKLKLIAPTDEEWVPLADVNFNETDNEDFWNNEENVWVVLKTQFQDADESRRYY